MMSPFNESRRCLLAAIASIGAAACQLKRPDTVPGRMIEPQLEEPAKQQAGPTDATIVRLLDTQARGHIGRHILRQLADGELIEDPVWRWSSAPDRYLDTALRRELMARNDVELVDAASVPAVAVTLLEWHLVAVGFPDATTESNAPRLVGEIELQLTNADRRVPAEVVRESEPVSPELPANVAAAAGRLLHRLASEGVTRMVKGVKHNQLSHVRRQ